MKRHLLILLFVLSASSQADVLVYHSKIVGEQLSRRSGQWSREKINKRAYSFIDIDANKANIWNIITRAEKNINGRSWKFAETSYEGEFDFIQAQTEQKLMWIMSETTEVNGWTLLTGKTKPTIIDGNTRTVAAKFSGSAIWDEINDANRTIGSSKITLYLDKKTTATVKGLTPEEAIEQKVEFLIESKGYVDCNASPCLCNARWETSPQMPAPRDSFAAGVIDGNIYVFGGSNGSSLLKSTEVYNPTTTQWTHLADNNTVSGVSGLTSAVVNGKLYVFGAWAGRSLGSINFNEVYNPASDTWATLSPKTSTMYNSAAVVYNDKIYLFGGYNNGDYYRTVESYNPADDTWSYVTDIPRTLSYFTIAVVGNKAYLFGGMNTASWETYNDIISYDFDTNLWNTADYANLPRYEYFFTNCAAPFIDGKIYIIGGQIIESDNWSFKTLYGADIYNPSLDSLAKAPLLPVPRINYAILNVDYKIYVLGGRKNTHTSSRPLADVFVLDTQLCSP